ncbi:MAG: beta-N-acetylhexosaminidase [Armatimonadetes bacterium]|nr:beta-N-acetylhexosaminidase [Armatimonadota bacterium]
MKKPFVSIAVAGAAISGAQVAVIPQPSSIQPAEGSFELNQSTRIAVNKDTEAVGEFARSYFAPATGFDMPLTRETGPNTIDLKLDKRLSGLGDEGYRLTVKKDRIEVRALKPVGVFYGIQTLRQLFPADIFRKAPASRSSWTVGCVHIEDSPRFGWRGAMIDSARHFMPKEFVLKYLDVMAFHKLNRFHIHLTDDTGWRIEIKRFPGLTGRSSGSDFSEMNPKGATRSINQKPGGYYTQDDIREIVAYAAKRFITVIPEIEMPGHAKAAIDAYPELGNLSQILQFGDKSKSGIWNNVFNVEDDTIKFLKQVLDEVMELFPSQWIHIGGDEVDKTPWKSNPKAQEKMASVGAKDEHELQSWFVKQFDDYLSSKGRRLIGWDEILEGGLAPKATVMSWRGMDGGIAAAKAKHEVVMAPTTYTYLDYYQSKDTKAEPKAIGGFLPLEVVYRFEPVPAELSAEEAKFILGGQFQLWTEFIPHPKHLEYMTFPRGCAVAEVVWSKKELRNYPDFLVRLNAQLERFRIMDVNYRALDGPGGK